jgi:hypothetical protein
MQCKEWNDEWVSHLYGELDTAETARLEQHLLGCHSCKEQLEGLQLSREWIQQGEPDLPAVPCVVVLKPRPAWSTAWSFAAGAACALLLFGSGFMIAANRTASAGPETLQAESQPTADPTEVAELRAELSSLRSRLDRVESAPATEAAQMASWEKELEQLEQRVQGERAKDLEYVMESLTATELRTGSWIDQTQDALTMLALRQDPNVREH